MDERYVLGDLVGYAPWPNEVADLDLRAGGMKLKAEAIFVAAACAACCAPLIVAAAAAVPPVLVAGGAATAIAAGVTGLRRRRGRHDLAVAGADPARDRAG